MDKQLCDAESKVMDAIVQFDQIKNGVVKTMSENLKAEAKRINSDNSTGGAGVDSTNFTSLMHNYLSVSNLAKKIDAGVEFACECLERGEKYHLKFGFAAPASLCLKVPTALTMPEKYEERRSAPRISDSGSS